MQPSEFDGLLLAHHMFNGLWCSVNGWRGFAHRVFSATWNWGFSRSQVASVKRDDSADGVDTSPAEPAVPHKKRWPGCECRCAPHEGQKREPRIDASYSVLSLNVMAMVGAILSAKNGEIGLCGGDVGGVDGTRQECPLISRKSGGGGCRTLFDGMYSAPVKNRFLVHCPQLDRSGRGSRSTAHCSQPRRNLI